MIKIEFPINQPKHLNFPCRGKISFPIHINDLQFDWTLTPNKIVLALKNGTAKTLPLIQHVDVVPEGVKMVIMSSESGVYKDVLITFEQLGLNLYTLGDMDSHTLGELDPIPLGLISMMAASWLGLSSTIHMGVTIYEETDEIGMMLESESPLTPTTNIRLKNLRNDIGVIGLNRVRNATLGELDPHLLGELDLMLAAFKVYESVPAQLVQSMSIQFDDTEKQ